jgi:hypothetical protein
MDSNKVYSPGTRIKYEEPHGIYDGLISVDTMLFMCPSKIAIKKSSREPDLTGEEGQITAQMRRATERNWTTAVFNYRCEDHILRQSQMERAVLSHGRITIGDHSPACILEPIK